MKHEIIDSIKHTLDGLSLATTIATIIQVLPAVAALFSIVWTGIRIWETDTIRKLRGLPVSKSTQES